MAIQISDAVSDNKLFFLPSFFEFLVYIVILLFPIYLDILEGGEGEKSRSIEFQYINCSFVFDYKQIYVF